MTEFLEVLAQRKARVARETAVRWQKLVLTAADGKGDPDSVLYELDDIGRTIEDLTAAVELVRRRREWARQLKSGAQAETELVAINEAAEKFRLKRQEMETALDEEAATLSRELSAVSSRIASAADAKRNLIDTASPEAMRQATAAVDAQIADSKREQAEVVKRIGDKSRMLGNATEPEHIERLRGELEKLNAELVTFNERFVQLNEARDAAVLAVLKPECV